MGGILPGGVFEHHRFVEGNEHHYSQIMLKRCVHDRNPLLPKMEDKYQSRQIVESKGVCNLAKLHHWSSESHKVPWDKLPLQCVIKTNHWSGDVLFILDNGPTPLKAVERKVRLFSNKSNRYKIIRNGRDQNGGFWPKWRIERALKKCLSKSFPVPLEWGAYSIFPRGVMVEELLLDQGELPDEWKVHVFHGKVGFIQHDIGRMADHSQAIYDLEGKQITQTNSPWSQVSMPEEIHTSLGEEKLSQLIQISEKLAEDIDYTRVDLYLCDGHWYFGEYTNYHNSCNVQSDEWELLGGSLWLAGKEEGAEV